MFEKLQAKLRFLTRTPTPLDPSRFNDPLALRTEWTPAKRGGASFQTHTLKLTGPTRAEFRPAIGAVIFYLLFFLIGLGVFAAFFFPLISRSFAVFNPGMIMPLLMSLLFAAIGAYMLYAGTAPIVFEKGRGVFWRGRKEPDRTMDGRNTKDFIRLDQVYAIQLVSEYISGKSSYYSYELNLVLEDGKRLNVIDHGNLSRIRKDAGTLAVFLGKPLWDATVRLRNE